MPHTASYLSSLTELNPSFQRPQSDQLASSFPGAGRGHNLCCAVEMNVLGPQAGSSFLWGNVLTLMKEGWGYNIQMALTCTLHFTFLLGLTQT